jgi:hypothetical protein
MTRRMRIYVAVLYVLAALAAVWSLGRMADARDAAAGAARDLADCRRYAGRIERLRTQPALAAERERLSGEVSGPIERAARAAGIPPERLVRISPEPAQRVCDSPYNEKPTRVLLRGVTIREVAAMVHGLAGWDEGLDLKALRLAATSRDAATDTWTAELVFAYLIYEPQQSRL